MAGKSFAETPLMKQYYSFKAKYPDAMLLFRVGDFYETYGEDAIKSSEILGIVLTKRSNCASDPIELAGFPYHALDNYLPKLVRAGLKVAVCEQLEDPKLAKKLVKRGIVELVTPGVTYNDNVLEQKENNFLASIHFDKNVTGVAFLDVSTGEFYLTQGNNEYIDKLLQSFNPSEVLLQRNKRKDFIDAFGGKYYLTVFDDWVFSDDYANEVLNKHFNTVSLKGLALMTSRKASWRRVLPFIICLKRITIRLIILLPCRESTKVSSCGWISLPSVIWNYCIR